MTAPEPLWTDAEVAAYLAVAPRAVLRLVRVGGLPCVSLPGSRRRYRPEAVRAWASARERVAAPVRPPAPRPPRSAASRRKAASAALAPAPGRDSLAALLVRFPVR